MENEDPPHLRFVRNLRIVLQSPEVNPQKASAITEKKLAYLTFAFFCFFSPLAEAIDNGLDGWCQHKHSATGARVQFQFEMRPAIRFTISNFCGTLFGVCVVRDLRIVQR